MLPHKGGRGGAVGRSFSHRKNAYDQLAGFLIILSNRCCSLLAPRLCSSELVAALNTI